MRTFGGRTSEVQAARGGKSSAEHVLVVQGFALVRQRGSVIAYDVERTRGTPKEGDTSRVLQPFAPSLLATGLSAESALGGAAICVFWESLEAGQGRNRSQRHSKAPLARSRAQPRVEARSSAVSDETRSPSLCPVSAR